MLNFKTVIRALGGLVFIEAGALLISAIVSLLYIGDDEIPLLISAALALSIALSVYYFTRKIPIETGKREGYLIVSLSWIVFSLIGALPFYISGSIPSYTDAFFETISGFTTTGASILNNIEEIPPGLLFWRSMTQWLGGMGIIVLSLAILPFLGIGGMQLFVAEVPGPTPDKLHPRIKETAKRLWIIYVGFTVVEVILLKIAGMTLFDSINHAFTTMATGGYSTKQASIAYWDNPAIHYIISLFMFIAGCNFTLSYFALHLRFAKVIQNEEFRYYASFVLGFTLVIGLTLFLQSDISFASVEKSFRDSLFQVVSIITTTGYATVDYTTWTYFALFLMFMLMFLGGSAGSTGGGIKIIRIVILLKNASLEFKRLIHPNAIIPVRINHHMVNPEIITNVLAFIVFYILIFIFGSAVMAFTGIDIDTAMGAAIACLGNIGPGIGDVGPAENFSQISSFGKWFLSFLMLIGRLEIFTVLILLSPVFWKE